VEFNKLNQRPPRLYSFRRCPYAIRARMAIKYSGIRVEMREVILRNKPDEMIKLSAKGEVPVLLLPDDSVLDESIDIIYWALSINDPEGWTINSGNPLWKKLNELVNTNDFIFKQHLDKYKYSVRFPEHPVEYYRDQGEVFLKQLDERLSLSGYLFEGKITVADIAIFPFIRQFANVDRPWFNQTPYGHLQKWLDMLLVSELFLSVMEKYKQWDSSAAPIYFP
jgi:glutathione S-transferase